MAAELTLRWPPSWVADVVNTIGQLFIGLLDCKAWAAETNLAWPRWSQSGWDDFISAETAVDPGQLGLTCRRRTLEGAEQPFASWSSPTLDHDLLPKQFQSSSAPRGELLGRMVTLGSKGVNNRHNQPLHIAVKCGNFMIAWVLIDNGSSLNVMPKATLDKLYCLTATLKNSAIVVWAFDGSKREVMGEITLPIRIGPTTFDIMFQVMEIRPEYSCLLGRPWIHATGAVPSSLQ
ncbi:hypothetical protein CR513_40661, partial [Mucuna pruriens]